MTLQDLFVREDAAPDLSSTPGDQQTYRLRQRCRELAETTARLERAEALVKSIKARRDWLSTKLLPDMMDEAGTDIIGIPEANVDVVVEPFVHAAIKADWSPEDRSRAFAALEAAGGASLVQAVLEIKFPREHLALAQQLAQRASAYLTAAYGNQPPPPVNLELAVHHATLTSWIKEEFARRDQLLLDSQPLPPPLPLGQIGATIGRVCKVKKRSQKAPAARKRRK